MKVKSNEKAAAGSGARAKTASSKQGGVFSMCKGVGEHGNPKEIFIIYHSFLIG